MQSVCDLQKKKLDEHDFHIQKLQKRTANYEDFMKRINEIDTERKILESKFGQEISTIRNHQELMREKVRVVTQDVEQFVSFEEYSEMIYIGQANN